MKAVFKSTGGAGGKDPVKELITFAAGDRIFAQGELGTEMFIIQEGEVDIIKRIGAESHALSRLEKGDFFGEMLRKNPEVAVRIIRKYSKRLREANTLLEKLVGREVDADHVALDATISAPSEKTTRHRMVDVATGTAFFFTNGDETTIGRADPVTGILPDIDLTPVDTNRSVSRRHAKIIRSGNEYFVLEEVGTVNGTYVNEQRIPTGQPVGVHHGDLIKIGLISFKAVFD